MMVRLTASILLVLFLVIPDAKVLAQDCKLPSWTVKDIKIKSRDAVGNSGSASFTIVPDATGKAESLACATLQGNYRCQVNSKAESGVQVDLQINTGVAHMSITQLKFPCGSSTYVYLLFLILFASNSLPLSVRCRLGANAGFLLSPSPGHRKSIVGTTDIDLVCTEATRPGGDISCTSEADGTIQAILL